MASLAEVPQLVVNGVMAGTILAVPAIGLTAIYAVLRFPNFALASHATIGAFAGYVVNVNLGLPILLQQSGNPKIAPGQPGYFEAGPLVQRLEVPTRLDRSEGDIHPGGNP